MWLWKVSDIEATLCIIRYALNHGEVGLLGLVTEQVSIVSICIMFPTTQTSKSPMHIKFICVSCSLKTH